MLAHSCHANCSAGARKTPDTIADYLLLVRPTTRRACPKQKARNRDPRIPGLWLDHQRYASPKSAQHLTSRSIPPRYTTQSVPHVEQQAQVVPTLSCSMVDRVSPPGNNHPDNRTLAEVTCKGARRKSHAKKDGIRTVHHSSPAPGRSRHCRLRRNAQYRKSSWTYWSSRSCWSCRSCWPRRPCWPCWSCRPRRCDHNDQPYSHP